MPLDRDLTREINRATADVLEDWIGREKWGSLVHTSTYGIRRYTNGSTLQAHVDVVATHAVSAILNVGQDVDSDWPLQNHGPRRSSALRDHGARRHGALRVGGAARRPRISNDEARTADKRLRRRRIVDAPRAARRRGRSHARMIPLNGVGAMRATTTSSSTSGPSVVWRSS